jgi:hypothetical protein
MGALPTGAPSAPDVMFHVTRGTGEHAGLVLYQHRTYEVCGNGSTLKSTGARAVTPNAKIWTVLMMCGPLPHALHSYGQLPWKCIIVQSL